MSSPNNLQRVSISQFADRFRNDMIPLANRFCYFCAAVGLSGDEMREYLEEPVAALPPTIAAALPSIRIFLVPYLEKPNGRTKDKQKDSAELLVTVEKPVTARSSMSGSLLTGDGAVLAFAVKDTEVADYHYRFYHAIAELVVAQAGDTVISSFTKRLREELNATVHGEVDEPGWRMKQALVRRSGAGLRDSKQFRDYLQHSFTDTLTLYLHGICCDIDVETGPRQLPSQWLRKRLYLLRDLFPPPEGYSVLPEDANSGA
jgi:hypothetical protein